jgi:hypothetical protein
MIFGILDGISPEMDNLLFMKRTADRLFGTGYRWSVLAAGRFQMPFETQSAMLGGSVRVGLEDSLYLGRGNLPAPMPSRSLGQIAGRVDLPRSTVQRIVGALQSERFVIAASPDRGIRLGAQLAARWPKQPRST